MNDPFLPIQIKSQKLINFLHLDTNVKYSQVKIIDKFYRYFVSNNLYMIHPYRRKKDDYIFMHSEIPLFKYHKKLDNRYRFVIIIDALKQFFIVTANLLHDTAINKLIILEHH